MSTEHVDVLIVGAGLSGIGAAHHLQARCPDKRYVIFEARDAIGGTWDLFRYPGIRSDSDMHTLGYRFRPWPEKEAIADGPSIRKYIRDTARDDGIEAHIRFGHRVRRVAWSSEQACWTIDADTDGGPVRLTAQFLLNASGYYNYDAGYTPDFPGRDRFSGPVIHPQHWPEDLDYSGKRVVVIGSGATAVTLVPAMADRAAHVTMLQRSPSYVVTLPRVDPVARWLHRWLPERTAYRVTRWKNVLLSMWFFRTCRRFPGFMRNLITKGVRQEVRDAVDVSTHFNPDYKPWDQRVCFVPDGDLFKALRAGTASMVTDHIDTFTETGIRLRSGQDLEADIIVTATGLDLSVLGGAEVTVDGQALNLGDQFVYKGMMLSGVPNMAFYVGYTNASWTLKCDLVSGYVCRVLNRMDRRGETTFVPRLDESVTEEPLIDFNSGYVLRKLDELPRQGTRLPWKLYQNYILDLFMLRFGRLGTAMEFRRTPVQPAAESPRPASRAA